MNDLISRQAAIDAVKYITSSMSVCVNTDECHEMKRMRRQAVIELANLPSVQPEQKTGRWVKRYISDFRFQYYCSVCGMLQVYGEPNYCPNCGAKMNMKGEWIE